MNRNPLLLLACAGAIVVPILAALPSLAGPKVLHAALPAAAPAAPPAAIAAAVGAVVTFPDGTTRPTLNGVDESVALQWSGDRPYAPVVAIQRDGDTEWFHHADGSWSTTLRRLDQATGKIVTLCTLFEPGPAKTAQLRGH